ncbi:MAG: hypothetical protein CM1200mP21_08730 [Candidatus Poseidoniales archaeon]|nr:MAG: hypothetical protein CM1200mP21_08730 [Candidatus Poseidoniales archaeon]
MAHGKSQRLRFKRRRKRQDRLQEETQNAQRRRSSGDCKSIKTQVVCQLAQFDPEGTG